MRQNKATKLRGTGREGEGHRGWRGKGNKIHVSGSSGQPAVSMNMASGGSCVM